MTSPYPSLVAAPTAVPWRYGLLSAATILPAGDAHEMNGIFFKSPMCARANRWIDPCVSGAPAEDKVPTDDDYSEVRADPFVAYVMLSCKTTTPAAMLDEVREAYALAYPRAVEQAFWESNLAVEGCTVLGGPGAVSPTTGLALLEAATADAFGGRATIHSPRVVAPFLASDGQIVTTGAAMFSVLGSALAFYGGSPNTGPDGTPAAAGTAWLYGTSQVVLRRFGVEVLPDARHVLALPTNEPMALAEETWVGTTSGCACFAVLVDVSP